MEVNGYKIEPGANLAGADLSGADLSRANLVGANLTGANLSGADLNGDERTRQSIIKVAEETGRFISLTSPSPPNYWNDSDLTRTNLSGANLSGATMPDGTIHD